MPPTFDKAVYGKLLAEFQPKEIESEEEYEQALEVVEKLMPLKERSPEQSALLRLFVSVIKEYEEEHYPMPDVPPHRMLQHLMEERGLNCSDLVGIFESEEVASEVLDGKRSIDIPQAKALGKFFHISPELFVSFD